MNIPVQNLYYLLSYAWDCLEESEVVDRASLESTSLLDLFAKVMLGGLERLRRRGLDRGYVAVAEETSTLRGKILMGPTISRNLLRHARAYCEHEELSHDVLHNRILKTTLQNLCRVPELDREHKERLSDHALWLEGVDRTDLNRRTFRRVQLHRNNRFYRFLLHVCELISQSLLVSTEDGQVRFQAFVDDHDAMSALFEQFVRNFFRREQTEYRVSTPHLQWQAQTVTFGAQAFLPVMIPDILIENEQRTLLIDTKYYREALRSRFGQEKIREAHLYQIFAYLQNYFRQNGSASVPEGMLLYPTVRDDIDLRYTLDKFPFRVKTINLNQEWQAIHSDLLRLLAA